MMNRICCRHCRMRFTVAASYLTGCPECGLPLVASNAESLVGYRLFDPLDVADVLPGALEVTQPVPNGDSR
jgi:hypothetical protein